MFYQFVGLTNDGLWYIAAVLPLSSPVLAETSAADSPLPEHGIPYPSPSDLNANMAAYYIAISDLLNVQLEESYTPSLSELDGLIQSMYVAP